MGRENLALEPPETKDTPPTHSFLLWWLEALIHKEGPEAQRDNWVSKVNSEVCPGLPLQGSREGQLSPGWK